MNRLTGAGAAVAAWPLWLWFLATACVPSGLGDRYESEARRLAEQTSLEADPITVEDLEPLPPQVQRYLRRVGALGKPHVRSFRATFDAHIRSGPGEPWLKGSAEQYEFFDPPARLFFMKARRGGLPVHVFHRYVGNAASMEGRLLGLITVFDVSGPELTQAETVTLLNDMFFLAPAALVDAPIEWEVLDQDRVRATYANAGHTVSAVAHFDEQGDLVDFDSRDRYQVDGNTARLARWSTPLYDYARFDGYRIASGGEARWGEPGEEWTYGRVLLEEIRYNAHREPPAASLSPPAPLARLDELHRLPIGPGLDVYHSTGFQDAAERLGRLLRSASGFFSDSLGTRLDLTLAVLDRGDWERMPQAYPYGLPYVTSRDAAHLVVLPATGDGAVHQALEGLEASLSPELRERLAATGLEWSEAVRIMVDLIGFHEIGHVCAKEYGISPPSRWFDEFLATYLASAHLARVDPGLAEVWELVSRAIVEGHTPRHRTLEDFEDLYFQVGVTDYAWYQAAFATRANALVRVEGLALAASARGLFPRGTGTLPPDEVLARADRTWPGFLAWSALFDEDPGDDLPEEEPR